MAVHTMKLAFAIGSMLCALILPTDALETRSSLGFGRRALSVLNRATGKDSNMNDADISAIADLVGSSDNTETAVAAAVPPPSSSAGSEATDLEALAGLDDEPATTAAPIVLMSSKLRATVRAEDDTPKLAPSHASVMEQERAAASLLATVAATSIAKTESGFQKEIDNLAAAVLKLARSGKLADGMQDFITEVQTILDLKMKQYIRDQFNQNNQSLYYSYGNISTCANGITNFGGMTNVTYNMPSLSTAHCSCRQEQTHLQEIYDAAYRFTNASCGLRDQYCRFKTDNDTLQDAIDGLTQCSTTPYANNDVKKYLQDQYNFYLAQYQIALYAKQRCDDAETNCQIATNASQAAYAKWLSKKMDCDAAQKDLDEASCTYRTDWLASCGNNGTYDACYDKKVGCFNQSLAETAALQNTLVTQMSEVLRISCFLGALNSTNINNEIQTCKSASYSSASDVTALMFPTYVLPPRKPAFCFPSPNASWASSGQVYSSTWYPTCSSLAGSCNATCCAATISVR
jgi:hypothetical protein